MKKQIKGDSYEKNCREEFGSSSYKASTELSCSVADLDYEIVQNPSSGFLGLGKKEAIIVVESKHKNLSKPIKEKYTKQEGQERFKSTQTEIGRAHV